MATPDKPDYTHGSTGTKPADGTDFQDRDALPADVLDWVINTPIETLKSVIGFLDELDSDGDGKVDAADQADVAATADAVKGNDIDSDADGIVDQADLSEQTRGIEVRDTDPDNPDNGRIWIRK